jgi:hypothetical protein
MKIEVAAPLFALFLVGCAGRIELSDYPAMPVYSYNATKAPIVANGPDEDAFTQVIRDYVRQTRHWADSEFRISKPTQESDCGCRRYEVDYLPDVALTPKGILFTGGYPNSFGLMLDEQTGKVLREYGLQ